MFRLDMFAACLCVFIRHADSLGLQVNVQVEFYIEGLAEKEKGAVSPASREKSMVQLPDNATFFQCVHMLYQHSHTKQVTEQAPWRRKYEIKYKLSVVPVAAGMKVDQTSTGLQLCSLNTVMPWPSDDTLQSALDTKGTKKKDFVSTLQSVAHPNWLHKNSLIGAPEVCGVV